LLYSYIVSQSVEPQIDCQPDIQQDSVVAELVQPDATILEHPVRRWLWTRTVKPLLDLLRVGATPRTLAWSIAVGAALGVNPILGISSVACLLAAFVFRLNVVATQIINHLVFPIQLALIVVFLGAGDRVFQSRHVPMSTDAFSHALRAHDWATARMLWTWEWHALTVWFAAALLLTPLVALALTPAIEKLSRGLKQEPVIEK
jgi:uncharacterized protein (DUF2062 family)